MLLIRTKSETASDTAIALRGEVQQQTWVIVPHSTDVRAARAAAAQAGDSNPFVLCFDFRLGVLVGILTPFIMLGIYGTGVISGFVLREVLENQQVLHQQP